MAGLDLSATHDVVCFLGAGTSFTSAGTKLASDGEAAPGNPDPQEESNASAMRADLSDFSLWIIDVGDVTGASPTVEVRFQDSADGTIFADLTDTGGNTVTTSGLVSDASTGDETRYFAHILHKRTRKWLRPVVTVGGTVTAIPITIYAVRGNFGNSEDGTLPALTLENY